MLWHRQAIFKSKGDKLCSSAESRIWSRDPRHQIASRLNVRWQTDWTIEDQAKKKTWTRQPVPMISEHSAHLTPLPVAFGTWLWRYTYLLLLISMLWHRQAISKSKGDKLCSSAESRIWTRDSRHQIASRLNVRWQTDWAIEDQAKKNLNSTARPHDQRALIYDTFFLTYIMLWMITLTGRCNLIPAQKTYTSYAFCGLFYQHDLTLIPLWIRNHTPSKVRDEIIHLSPNISGATELLNPHVFTEPGWSCDCFNTS